MPVRAPRASLLPFALLIITACGAGAPSLPPPPLPVTTSAAAPLLQPARFLVVSPTSIDRTDDGLDRVIAEGRRMELWGLEPVALAPGDPEVDGGARAPTWTTGPWRYLFYRGRRVYVAKTFTGELRFVGTVRSDIRGTFNWTSGVGVLLEGGAVIVPSAGGAPVPAPVPSLVRGIAADGRRAVVATALGHTLLTVDGGLHFRDESRALAGVADLEVRGDEVLAVLPDGHGRFISATGAIRDAGRGEVTGSPSPKRVNLTADPFPDVPEEVLLHRLVPLGLPLPDGGIVIASGGFVGRFDLASRRTTSVVALDPSLAAAECVAFRAEDGPLLACASDDRASIVDLDDAPRTERTFDLGGVEARDRFVAGEGGALGYVGPCEGLEEPTHASETVNASPQASPVFCVRVRRDEWVEHRVHGTDAAEIIAWIPRRGGGAVAIVERAGPLINEHDRVTVHGSLRVVRLAQGEPPLSINPTQVRVPQTLARSLRVDATDVIEGFLPVLADGNAIGPVTLGADGRPSVGPIPADAKLAASGRFALIASPEGRLYESTDGGHHFARVAPAPAEGAHPSECSEVGCNVGPFVRIGWGPALREAPDEPTPAPSKAISRRGSPPPSPIVRLTCAAASPPDGKKLFETTGFGLALKPHPSMSGARIGGIGLFEVPANGRFFPAAGDASLAWVPPLDLAAPVKRATVSLDRLAIPTDTRRNHFLHLGYLLHAKGAGLVSVFPVASRGSCVASLLEAASVARSIGGCAPDPSVGVDLGDRTVVLHQAPHEVSVFAAEATRGSGHAARSDRSSSPVALRKLKDIGVGSSLAGFTLGAGVWAGAPVAVVVDVHGDAVLAPIDPERGTLGPEERLAPLATMALGSAPACVARANDARVLLAVDHALALDPIGMPRVAAADDKAVMVLRWSGDRACLDALDLPVNDDRFDEELDPTEPSTSVRRIAVRFDTHGAAKGGAGILVEVAGGVEIRQRVECTAIAKVRSDEP